MNQHVQRNQYRHNRAADVNRDDRPRTLRAHWNGITDAEETNEFRIVMRAALDPADRYIDIAAEQTDQQCCEGELRGQSQRVKGVANYADLEKREEQRHNGEEDEREENEKRREEHRPILSWDDRPAGELIQELVGADF